MGADPLSTVPGGRVWGHTTIPELLWLGDQAARMDSVVEVGSLRGRSAYMLLSYCPGPVYCIDEWADEGDHAYRGFVEVCSRFSNLHAVRGSSPAVAADVPDVDMVFLDADHTYAGINADLDAWLPKARKLICGHDYDPNLSWDEGGQPGVWDAVRERFGEDRVEHPADTVIWAVRL